MWVEKKPRRSDFCGCPGCPICYDWADGGIVYVGIQKWSKELLGTDLSEASVKEKKELEEGAELVHARNLAKIDPLKEADEKRQMEFLVQQNAMLNKQKEKTQVRPKMDSRPVLDNIDLDATKKEEKKEEKVKEKVRATEEVKAFKMTRREFERIQAMDAQDRYTAAERIMQKYGYDPKTDAFIVDDIGPIDSKYTYDQQEQTRRFNEGQRRMAERKSLRALDEKMRAKMNMMARYGK